jgi:hypothetical protein
LLALSYAGLLSTRSLILTGVSGQAVGASVVKGSCILPAFEGTKQLILDEDGLKTQLALFSPEALQVAIILEAGGFLLASAGILAADTITAVENSLNNEDYLARMAFGPGNDSLGYDSFDTFFLKQRPLVVGSVKTLVKTFPLYAQIPFKNGTNLQRQNIASALVRQEGVVRSDSFGEYLIRQMLGANNAKEVLKKYFFQIDGTCLVKYDDTTVLVADAEVNRLLLSGMTMLAKAPLYPKELFVTDFSGLDVPKIFTWGDWVAPFLLDIKVGSKEWVLLVKNLKFSPTTCFSADSEEDEDLHKRFAPRLFMKADQVSGYSVVKLKESWIVNPDGSAQQFFIFCKYLALYEAEKMESLGVLVVVAGKLQGPTISLSSAKYTSLRVVHPEHTWIGSVSDYLKVFQSDVLARIALFGMKLDGKPCLVLDNTILHERKLLEAQPIGLPLQHKLDLRGRNCSGTTRLFYYKHSAYSLEGLLNAFMVCDALHLVPGLWGRTAWNSPVLLLVDGSTLFAKDAQENVRIAETVQVMLKGWNFTVSEFLSIAKTLPLDAQLFYVDMKPLAEWLEELIDTGVWSTYLQSIEVDDQTCFTLNATQNQKIIDYFGSQRGQPQASSSSFSTTSQYVSSGGSSLGSPYSSLGGGAAGGYQVKSSGTHQVTIGLHQIKSLSADEIMSDNFVVNYQNTLIVVHRYVQNLHYGELVKLFANSHWWVCPLTAEPKLQVDCLYDQPVIIPFSVKVVRIPSMWMGKFGDFVEVFKKDLHQIKCSTFWPRKNFGKGSGLSYINLLRGIPRSKVSTDKQNQKFIIEKLKEAAKSNIRVLSEVSVTPEVFLGPDSAFKDFYFDFRGHDVSNVMVESNQVSFAVYLSSINVGCPAWQSIMLHFWFNTSTKFELSVSRYTRLIFQNFVSVPKVDMGKASGYLSKYIKKGTHPGLICVVIGRKRLTFEQFVQAVEDGEVTTGNISF